jgi:hypothetical protein
VPFGAEIGVGSYRLRIERNGTAAADGELRDSAATIHGGFAGRDMERTGFPRPAHHPSDSRGSRSHAGARLARGTDVFVLRRRHRRRSHRLILLAAATWFLLGPLDTRIRKSRICDA